MTSTLLRHFHDDIRAIDAWIRRKGTLTPPFSYERFRSRELLDTSQRYDILYMPWEQLQVLINQVRMQRRMLLAQYNIDNLFHRDDAKKYPSGRLLAFDPGGSLYDGAAASVTDGFFDGDTVPAWDCWLTSVSREESEFQGRWRPFQAFMVCWIPMELVDLVQAGIDVNPGDCIMWLQDIPQYE